MSSIFVRCLLKKLKCKFYGNNIGRFTNLQVCERIVDTGAKFSVVSVAGEVVALAVVAVDNLEHVHER
jgi:hypothetical protein